MSLLSGSFTRSESYTWQIPGSGNVISSSTVASKNTFLHNGTYGGPNVYSFTWSANYTYLADALTRESIYGYNTRESVSGYATRESVSGYATRESVSGYGTRSSVSAYGTRSSVSGYGTRASTSGYSGVSSSSSSSSESASGTCWR